MAQIADGGHGEFTVLVNGREVIRKEGENNPSVDRILAAVREANGLSLKRSGFRGTNSLTSSLKKQYLKLRLCCWQECSSRSRAAGRILPRRAKSLTVECAYDSAVADCPWPQRRQGQSFEHRDHRVYRGRLCLAARTSDHRSRATVLRCAETIAGGAL